MFQKKRIANMKKIKYTSSVDVWALGCILAEFALRRPLFEGHSDLEQISLICKVLGTPNKARWASWDEMPDAGKIVFEENGGEQDWRRIVPNASDSLIAHLKRHLKWEAADRLTADQLTRLPFSQSTLTDIRYIPCKRRSVFYLPKALRRL
ncbi:hypothetical protein WR25_07975 [Diploscapter pachys]|uniref:Protein kinase domain-containing protein n=1 Tax=Diploscapter pachys TaxID=2018661 RepID=A0A2A2KP05_9BILA|nr:hypothetical protein WR25_07975 [Diploscapter pachys]